jgi:hypothetical protein
MTDAEAGRTRDCYGPPACTRCRAIHGIRQLLSSGRCRHEGPAADEPGAGARRPPAGRYWGRDFSRTLASSV